MKAILKTTKLTLHQYQPLWRSTTTLQLLPDRADLYLRAIIEKRKHTLPLPVIYDPKERQDG